MGRGELGSGHCSNSCNQIDRGKAWRHKKQELNEIHWEEAENPIAFREALAEVWASRD